MATRTTQGYARELRMVQRLRSLVDRAFKDSRRKVAVLEAARMLVKPR